jgi:hypothetical protein
VRFNHSIRKKFDYSLKVSNFNRNKYNYSVDQTNSEKRDQHKASAYDKFLSRKLDFSVRVG